MSLNILVLYYTQSGQLKQILDNMLSPLEGKARIDFVSYKPVDDFPFPWTSDQFFDAMPECVKEISVPLQPFTIPDIPYDLVILGYQPWFLSPSVPTTSFLQSSQAAALKGKPVITVVGSRNMWLNAQERVKGALNRIGARHVGNIVLADTNHNLISLFTIIRWTFTGQKEAGRFLPEAGVQTKDINASGRFGNIIYNNALSGGYDRLQPELLEAGAVSLKPTLIVLEKRGITNFRKFATYIREKGERGNPERMSRVRLFKRLLLTGIFVLSPVSGLTAKLESLFKKKSFKRQLDYFRGVKFQQDVI
ncbi:hypothetical protein [Flavihumibacter petaseus]|uniref:Dialkylrecorsinol condensing enzyme n=1 Tax=Flavihumibacter petaseus NBRC 106054 TaxID=1220578 RepID=A0A0E9MUL5_9BACT|nr:hypothetical protein [Flavihumibacter petaseus]GAO41178.1 hypothetical protein FPE01S_01_01900 [Flavihumibacter petaseus NBRC 106054]